MVLCTLFAPVYIPNQASELSLICKVQETKFKIRPAGPDDISSSLKITERKHPSTAALEDKGLDEISSSVQVTERKRPFTKGPKQIGSEEELLQEMENVGSQVAGGASSSAQGSYFTPLLISMVGILCTTLLIMAYHFIVVRLCIRRRQRQILRQLQLGLSTNPTTSNGVDEKVLNSIPILSYSTKDGDLFCADQSECVICLGELQDGDLVKLLPSCKHVFHNLCIDKWFLGHTNCPICRSLISAPIAPVGSSPVENHEVRDGEQQTDTNFSEQPHDQEMGVLSNENIVTSTTSSTQLPKPNCLLRHCVSLVVLPIEGNNNVKEQSILKGLERSLSLDECHVVINIQGENDEKPSSSSSSSCSSKPVLTQCGSFKARSMRQLDRMSSVLSRSLSQFGIAQSSSTANGNGILPC